MTAHQQSLPFALDSHVIDMAEKTQQYCTQCDYLWYKRAPGVPRRCPSCGSYAWNKPKKKHRVRSKGRAKRHDLLGRTFGRWTVIEQGPTLKSRTRWVCKCICENIKIVSTEALVSGDSQSCGCKFAEMVGLKRLRPYERLYKSLIECGVQRSIPINITYEEFLGFTTILECHYCGVEIIWNEYGGKSGTVAYHLDRIDSSGPYSVENCVVCCKRCNWAKLHLFTYSEWVKIGNLIRSWRQ